MFKGEFLYASSFVIEGKSIELFRILMMGKIPVQKAKVVLWELKKRDIQEGSMNWNDLKHIAFKFYRYQTI